MGMFSFCLYIGLQKGFCQIDGVHYNYPELNLRENSSRKKPSQPHSLEHLNELFFSNL